MARTDPHPSLCFRPFPIAYSQNDSHLALYEGEKMANDTKIAFLDLVTPHVELEEELVASFRSALRSAAFIGGPAVESFEQDFATFCDTRFCVGVGSGTDALRFALAAAGIAKGDCVITVPNTFIATTEAISQVGAQPEFVDVDEQTSTMDVEKLRAFLEQQCEWDIVRTSGVEADGTSGHRNRSSSSLWSSRRHGSHHGIGGALQP